MSECNIERVDFVDGHTNKSGWILRKDVLYASEKRHVLDDTFWLIQTGSLSLWKKANAG